MRLLLPLLLAFALLGLASPAAAAAQDAPGPKCFGTPCDVILAACHVYKKDWTCVKTSRDALLDGRCAGDPCDAINRLCDRLFDVKCVG